MSADKKNLKTTNSTHTSRCNLSLLDLDNIDTDVVTVHLSCKYDEQTFVQRHRSQPEVISLKRYHGRRRTPPGPSGAATKLCASDRPRKPLRDTVTATPIPGYLLLADVYPVPVLVNLTNYLRRNIDKAILPRGRSPNCSDSVRKLSENKRGYLYTVIGYRITTTPVVL
ncbi:hypothetical protein GWI33_011807 [Rhynchophorus ferrugineus]|uniref:Uncharacterized protein n=1 Tax=Rhynchophorus ferrugineus TaxID=354439 RepID=A0A834M984_RHYFE|nr:hypothetical protein GWI33_011807 [Rhynchophorus ferrugineus]